MATHKGLISKVRTSCVLVYDGYDLPGFSERLSRIAKALTQTKIKTGWIIACDAFSSQDLAQNPVFQRLQAQACQVSSVENDWPAFCSVSAHVADDWLLLLPGDIEISPEEALQLTELASQNLWAGFSPGAVPFWQKLFLGSRSLSIDLGAPCLVQREALNKISSLYPWNEALLGYRLFSKACALKTPVGILPARQEKTAELTRRLGLNQYFLLKDALSTVNWGVLAVVYIYLSLFMSKDNVYLGLSLFGVSLVLLASLFGKPE